MEIGPWNDNVNSNHLHERHIGGDLDDNGDPLSDIVDVDPDIIQVDGDSTDLINVDHERNLVTEPELDLSPESLLLLDAVRHRDQDAVRNLLDEGAT
jgi:hypothetical protein